MKFFALIPLAAISWYVLALHRALGLRGVWVQWQTRDISSLLTGVGSAPVDRAFYLLGAALVFAGWVLCGFAPGWIPYAIGGAALAGAALSRAVWPEQTVHVACALLAFAGIASGNAYYAFLAQQWLLFGVACMPILIVAVWRSTDGSWAHGFEWCAAGAVLAATAALLIVRILA